MHTIEPDPATIEDGAGELIGESSADCAYCGRRISGDEDGWYHVEELEWWEWVE